MKIAKCCYVCIEYCRNVNCSQLQFRKCDKKKIEVHGLQICEHFSANVEQITRIHAKITKKN